MLVDCPNGGKCGNKQHRVDSGSYIECMRVATAAANPPDPSGDIRRATSQPPAIPDYYKQNLEELQEAYNSNEMTADELSDLIHQGLIPEDFEDRAERNKRKDELLEQFESDDNIVGTEEGDDGYTYAWAFASPGHMVSYSEMGYAAEANFTAIEEGNLLSVDEDLGGTGKTEVRTNKGFDTFYVPILDDSGDVTAEAINMAEILDGLRDYPLIDDEVYSRQEREREIETVEELLSFRGYDDELKDVYDGLSTKDAEGVSYEVVSYLSENGLFGDNGTFVDDDDFETAIRDIMEQRGLL